MFVEPAGPGQVIQEHLLLSSSGESLLCTHTHTHTHTRTHPGLHTLEQNILHDTGVPVWRKCSNGLFEVRKKIMCVCVCVGFFFV